jgi:hypothetical protein
MPKPTVTKTKLYDHQGRHVATRIDEDTIRDERTGQVHRMSQPRTQQACPQPRVLTIAQAKALVDAALHKGVPPAPQTTQRVVEIQRQRNQR